ncbi:MAG: tetratricopeptide repeat protein [Longimicrobiales bacterium]
MRIHRNAALFLLALSPVTPAQLLGQGTGHGDHGSDGTQDGVPLYQDLGDHHYPIAGADEKVQAYFDQGLRLYYAFNHAEAVRSFQEARRLDPDCAMCAWGEALALGPNINMPMDSASGVQAYHVVRDALGLLDDDTPPREAAMVRALATRYERVPQADRSQLDQAYAEAMKDVVDRFSYDLEAGVLYAESLMDLRPWDYWTEDGQPQPGIEEALEHLESVQTADSQHPGACHFFIHAVEKLYPERAVPCAERLADLMPGAGHIVHMPGHIYIRVGRYEDAIKANEHAVHADESFIQDQRPGLTVYTAGYYPHNYDFLAFAAMMLGREEQSIEAAKQVEALIPNEMFGQHGMDFLEHWSIRPLLVQVQFKKWEDVLNVAAPPVERSHARAIWHYAQGRALVGTGKLDRAKEELDYLRQVSADAAGSGKRMEFNASADLLQIAEFVLSGWVEAGAGRFEPALEKLSEAVRLEDALLYGEPPEWTVPVRHDLGEVLLLAGQPEAAMRVFEADLKRFPKNYWSADGVTRARRQIERGPQFK